MPALLFRHIHISLFHLGSLLAISGAAVWAHFALAGSGVTAILRFNSEQGIIRIGDPGELNWIAALGAVVVLVSWVLSLELAERDVFLCRLLTAGTMVFATLLFIGFAAIIGAN